MRQNLITSLDAYHRRYGLNHDRLDLCGAAVPLLHFNGTPRAFEATWKYLLVGGTGIALSLLGSFCLGYASLHGGGAGDLTFAAFKGPVSDVRRLSVRELAALFDKVEIL